MMPPKIELTRFWTPGRDEVIKQRHGETSWRISDLLDLLKDEPEFEVPIAHLDLGNHTFDTPTLLHFARHMLHVNQSDLEKPIIMDEWGGLLDGRHRIVKALMEGRETIKCKRVPTGTHPTM